MKKTLLWVALGLMATGVALFVALGIMVDFDFSRLDTVRYETNSYDISDPFHSIDIDTISADIEFRLAEDGKCRMVCYEREKLVHNVTVTNDTLMIEARDQRTWVDHLTIFNSTTPSITIYLPEAAYHSLKVSNTTGDLKLAGAWSIEELDVSVTTGDILLDHLQTKNMNMKGTTGDIIVKNVTVSQNLSVSWTTGDLSIVNSNAGSLLLDGGTGDATIKDVIVAADFRSEMTTGDLKLERCDAGELYLKTTTGDITAKLLSQKVVFAHATTGDVDVPSSTTGGRCEITTTTGDITVKFG